MKKILLFGILLLLIGCGVPEERALAPTPTPIHIVYPAALKSWANKFYGCSFNNPMIALYFHQSPTSDMNIDTNEIMLNLGELLFKSEHLYLSQVGREQIEVIVNQDNELSQISASKLQSIFSGQTSSWDNDVSQPIKVWVLPNGDPVRMSFEQSLMQSGSLTSEAMLAPDPEAMLEAISSDANAIGYVPNLLLSTSDPSLAAKVKKLQVDTSLREKVNQPVIAVTQGEPEGLIRELLVCVQGVIP